MTNTTSPVPATQTGIACGRCSTGFGKDRLVVRHASVAAVRTCFATPVAPVVEVPPAVLPAAPKKFDRYSASCPRKGCQTKAVKDQPFTLKCSNHGAPVRTRAKQLVGQFSDSPKHKCNDACMFATGPTCTCGCGGANHGLGYLVKL